MYEGWSLNGGCIICPVCDVWIVAEEYVTEILATIDAHKCAS